MRISFMQAGGVAGVSRGLELDTSTLPESEAREVARLVEQLGDGAGAPRPAGPDVASYLVRIEEAGVSREHTFRDGSMSGPAAELVRFLSSRARPRRL